MHTHSQATLYFMKAMLALWYTFDKTLNSGNIFVALPLFHRVYVRECHSQSITIFLCVYETLKSHQTSTHTHTYIHRDVFDVKWYTMIQ